MALRELQWVQKYNTIWFLFLKLQTIEMKYQLMDAKVRSERNEDKMESSGNHGLFLLHDIQMWTSNDNICINSFTRGSYYEKVG